MLQMQTETLPMAITLEGPLSWGCQLTVYRGWLRLARAQASPPAGESRPGGGGDLKEITIESPGA